MQEVSRYNIRIYYEHTFYNDYSNCIYSDVYSNRRYIDYKLFGIKIFKGYENKQIGY
jgi:hypothetical protein